MIDVASFSGGRLSAVMVERLFQSGRHPYVVFMDTKTEDDDNYRFIAECDERWYRLYGLTPTRLCEGRTPYEVSHAQHVIPNSLLAPCTNRLKIEPFRAYLQDNFAGQDVTIHIGYDFSEMHRCEPTRAAYAKYGWSVDFPMLWTPIEFRPYSEIIRSWGIEPPRMYAMGYSHANCGGVCVKQGAGDWIKTLINFPDRFAQAEEWECEMRKNPTNAAYTILKRTRGGKIENLTLEQLRIEYQHDQKGALLLASDFMCIRCGIGDFVE